MGTCQYCAKEANTVSDAIGYCADCIRTHFEEIRPEIKQVHRHSRKAYGLLTQHYVLLQRNLIYTGVTRGRKLVVIAGTRKVLAIGVKNDKTEKRYTYLRHRLT